MQGFILLDKPKGITSFGAVARIKRLCGEKRVGHTGTLDPMATGVLPVFIGRATTLSGYLLEADKTYIASAKLGISTDTCDITGNVTEERAVYVTFSDVKAALLSFKGKQKQIPPMFSALKHDGVRLYDLARRGETVDIEPRDIEIYDIEALTGLDENNEFSFKVKVSKGTYIRSLIRDLGTALGTGAVMTALVRTETAGFDIKDCVSLDDLTYENIGEHILPADTAVKHIKKLTVTEKQGIRFSNGGQLDLDRLKISDVSDGVLYRVYSGDKFLGLGYVEAPKNRLSIKCLV